MQKSEGNLETSRYRGHGVASSSRHKRKILFFEVVEVGRPLKSLTFRTRTKSRTSVLRRSNIGPVEPVSDNISTLSLPLSLSLVDLKRKAEHGGVEIKRFPSSWSKRCCHGFSIDSRGVHTYTEKPAGKLERRITDALSAWFHRRRRITGILSIINRFLVFDASHVANEPRHRGRGKFSTPISGRFDGRQTDSSSPDQFYACCFTGKPPPTRYTHTYTPNSFERRPGIVSVNDPTVFLTLRNPFTCNPLSDLLPKHFKLNSKGFKSTGLKRNIIL